MQPRPANDLVLIACFLLIIFGVPVVQTTVELTRGERVQAATVVRLNPTASTLRRYVKTLEDRSVVNQWSRPVTQAALFGVFGDVGSKAVTGRDGWLFYRPDLRYLVAPDLPEAADAGSRWAPPADRSTHQDSVRHAILRFHGQLQQRGIRLVVVPVPGKPGIYPDQVTRRLAGASATVTSPTERLIEKLRNDGVAVVDLFAAFRQARSEDKVTGPLYLNTDTHWTPRGADLAARVVAERLHSLGLGLGPAAAFQTRQVTVQRRGDILEMAQIPGLSQRYDAETIVCEQVLDPALGPLIPTPSDRPGCYKYPAKQSSVLVLGDSFCRIYQYPEPRSLGELSGAAADGGGKRLLPGSAGFVSRLALALGAPVDAIVSDGGASTDVRQKLSTNPEILEGKTVVIWEFVERDIALGRAGWEEVPLPAALGAAGSAGQQGAARLPTDVPTEASGVGQATASSEPHHRRLDSECPAHSFAPIPLPHGVACLSAQLGYAGSAARGGRGGKGVVDEAVGQRNGGKGMSLTCRPELREMRCIKSV